MAEPAIRTPDHRLRVFVSSTLVELAAERRAARAAIEQLRLSPVMFESGARPHPAQAVYQAYVAQSDVFVGIYADSYGWVGPGMIVSGLQDELERAAGLPRLLYVKSPAPGRDAALSRMLDEIRARGQTAYKRFTDADELHELILTDLATLLAERFAGPRDGRAVAIPPAPATSLVGRDEDLARIVDDLVSGDRRLVVLTGAGGIGKTRLALAAQERTAPHWRDGVAFVDLSPVTDGRLVPDAIASALGVVGQGHEGPLDALQRALSSRHLLVLLDNVEHVVDAAPALADLLRRTPRLSLLVTSRVSLRIRGEREHRVSALAQPAALRLLVDRVRDVRPGFELTAENASALAELCRRLGGLPLALELAAAWMRLLTPDQMLTQVYERLERPGAFVDLPHRQQTLTGTVSWSYDLLPGSARRLLTRLSVFAAPFTVDGVVAVCGDGADDAVRDLSTLLDSSMVSPVERMDGEGGFQLLEPIRRFAAARRDPADDTLSRLHEHVLDVLRAADTSLGSRELILRRLDSELPNLQVVLEWLARTRHDAGPLLRALGDVWVWLLARGLLRQASGLWQRIEALPHTGSPRDRLARQWLTASRLLNDGDFPAAAEVLDEMIPIGRPIESPARMALLLSARAIVRPHGAHERALAEFAEALLVAEQADDPHVTGYVLSHYGLSLNLDGRAAEAVERHHDALEIADALADQNLRAEAHYDLAMDALVLDNRGSARSHLASAVDGYRDIDHVDGLIRCVGALGTLALHTGDSQLAARLIGAAAAARDAIGLVPWPSVFQLEQRTADAVTEAVAEADLTAMIDVAATSPSSTPWRRQKNCWRRPAANRLGAGRNSLADQPHSTAPAARRTSGVESWQADR
ncbi:hypothetical protein Ais01nite_13280 [Asanoa ishikariensis]|uniref:Predicted ATPase n=1 Tax=Asanoa ishikariensis TaxID=137265 RepID=A0A1H3SYU1_9ACTN|nr:DUF4062 domain-containing protein [Asanoa ishikariensis]GIF63293.1 hypothetical protein Ais01nite_13280 [Asanoa ishikariensis]SDZ42675.1 Predicted ATPase [Asanoa ishikariensis]